MLHHKSGQSSQTPNHPSFLCPESPEDISHEPRTKTRSTSAAYFTNKNLPPTPLELVDLAFPDSIYDEFPFPVTYGELETWDPESDSSLIFTIDSYRDEDGSQFIIVPQTPPLHVGAADDDDTHTFELVPLTPSQVMVPHAVRVPFGVQDDENEYSFNIHSRSPRTASFFNSSSPTKSERRDRPSLRRQNRSAGLLEYLLWMDPLFRFRLKI
ncbi:hypothetical protein CPB84DRAFT_1793403, partial [Gymnopilus junonius]